MSRRPNVSRTPPTDPAPHDAPGCLEGLPALVHPRRPSRGSHGGTAEGPQRPLEPRREGATALRPAERPSAQGNAGPRRRCGVHAAVWFRHLRGPRPGRRRRRPAAGSVDGAAAGWFGRAQHPLHTLPAPSSPPAPLSGCPGGVCNPLRGVISRPRGVARTVDDGDAKRHATLDHGATALDMAMQPPPGAPGARRRGLFVFVVGAGGAVRAGQMVKGRDRSP